jgi:hypothetical protein
MKDARLEKVLQAIATVDRRRADRARSVIEWLTGGEGLDGLDLAGVQRFAWYELPLKWSGPPDRHAAVLEVAGELFKGLGLERYAAVFRSPETMHILDAYGRSEREGFKAFQAAYQRSGVDPPDLDDFEWGEVMGWEEASALRATERALEEAIVAGDLTPGTSGWKSVARAVTARVLDGPHPEISVQSLRHAILTERLENWLGGAERRSRDLHSLRSRHVKRLLHPVPVPTDVSERMGPVTWFLNRAEDGVRLTQAGYLPTAMVREGWQKFGWDLGWTDRSPRSESEVVQLYELHELLRRSGGVRRRGPDLRITAKGRRMAQDVETAWRTVAAGLSDGDWPRVVAEVITLLLLDGVALDREREARAAAMLGDAGWRADGEPPGSMMVMSAWHATRRPLAALGGVERAGDWRTSETILTGFGEATLLEQIRATATGPRSRRW